MQTIPIKIVEVRKVLLFLSIALFIASLFLPCYSTPDDNYYGVAILCGGWLIFTGIDGIGWFANPLLFIAYIIYKKLPVLSVLLCSIAFLIAITIPEFTSIQSYMDEIHSYDIGYWLWVISCLLMTTVCVLNLIHQQQYQQT